MLALSQACMLSEQSTLLLATAGVDKALKVWDVRKPHQEVAVLLGHSCIIELSVRQGAGWLLELAHY